MDSIKEAFQKVKQDIDFLHSEFDLLKTNLKETNAEMAKITEILIQMNQTISKNQEKHIKRAQTHPTQNNQKQTIPTHNPTQNPLSNNDFKGISTGNEGVPTDRQTNQQTDRHIENNPKPLENTNDIDNAALILDSLDNIKKEIRLKFKRLTDQEILVFSTLWQLSDEAINQRTNQDGVDYKTIAQKLGLTESSIRDYIGKLIGKGIPVEKTKVNNKTILLSISINLRKIASLPTILQLRDL